MTLPSGFLLGTSRGASIRCQSQPALRRWGPNQRPSRCRRQHGSRLWGLAGVPFRIPLHLVIPKLSHLCLQERGDREGLARPWPCAPAEEEPPKGEEGAGLLEHQNEPLWACSWADEGRALEAQGQYRPIDAPRPKWSRRPHWFSGNEGCLHS